MRLLVLVTVLALAHCACKDKKDNLVAIADTSEGAFNGHLQNAVGATYDSKGAPSCFQSRPNLKLPGVLQFVSGQLLVKEAIDLVGGTEIYLTLKKDSWLIGTVCDHGKSKNPLIPDSDCKFAFCEKPSSLCTAFSTPGTHSLEEIEGALGINGTIELPALSNAINGILKGKWQVTLDIQNNGKTVASIKIPSNEDYIDIGE